METVPGATLVSIADRDPHRRSSATRYPVTPPHRIGPNWDPQVADRHDEFHRGPKFGTGSRGHLETFMYAHSVVTDMSRITKLLIVLVVVALAWKFMTREPDIDVEYELD